MDLALEIISYFKIEVLKVYKLSLFIQSNDKNTQKILQILTQIKQLQNNSRPGIESLSQTEWDQLLLSTCEQLYKSSQLKEQEQDQQLHFVVEFKLKQFLLQNIIEKFKSDLHRIKALCMIQEFSKALSIMKLGNFNNKQIIVYIQQEIVESKVENSEELLQEC